MSVRKRLILLIVLVGTVPAVLAGVGTSSYMQRLIARRGQSALQEIGEAAIYDQALTTAQQLDAYLRAHPGIDLTDTAALESNAELALLAVQPVGKTGYTAVFDADGITHFHVNPAVVGMDMSTLADTRPVFWAVFERSLDGTVADGYYDWEEADGTVREKYMAIVPVGNSRLRVAATTYMDEFSASGEILSAELTEVSRQTRLVFALTVVVVAIASVVIGIVISDRLTRPLAEMADEARRVIAGDWDAIQPVPRSDELGVLAGALYEMTARLRELVQSLERRVTERTRVLQATTEVSRAISAQLDPDALVREVVDLVRERFDLYYVGLFAVDASTEWAVLQAGTGTFGQMMLVQEHRLRVGGRSMIGQCIILDEPQVLMDTDEATVRFDNPLLPDTRSELALPMHSRGRVIGAMTVHSDRPLAFDQAYIDVLQSMADQVAAAMDNARLFSEAQGAVAELEAAQKRYAGQVWSNYTQERGVRGYAQTRRGMLSLHQQILPEVRQAMSAQRPIIGRGRSAQGIRSAIRPLMGSSQEGTAEGDRASPSALVAPILIGSQPIGALGLRDAEGVREWNEADIELVQAISAQFSEAAENLRLLEQTQQRESIERVTREVTEEIRAATTVEDAVRRTLRALGRVLGASRMTARLGAGGDLVEQTRRGAEHE